MEVEDLVGLNPPTTENLLRVLHRRFKRDVVHTRLGARHLIAINPYRMLRPDSHDATSPEQLIDMMRIRLSEGLESRQLLLTLGESGSGKSQILLQGLQQLAADSPHLLAGINLLRRNCRTHRNEDASRFILVVDLQLDFRGQVVTSAIQTYMLEKEVVTGRIRPNFHVFYAILAGADPQLLKSLRLSRSADSYAILAPLPPAPTNAQTGKESFEQIKTAFSIHRLDEKAFFQIIAFILKLGNIFFIPVTRMDGTAGLQLEPRAEFQEAVDIFGIDETALESALLYEVSGSMRDPIGASALRDALLRALYTRLFRFLSAKVSASPQTSPNNLFSLLDFPGFQSLEKNHFQELLLNLIGEKVQEVLVDGELKDRQEEWLREGLQWVRVDTRSNPPSVLYLLEQNGPLCGSRSDEEILDLILDGSPAASRLSGDQFRIRHFAGTICYSRNFQGKLIDSLPMSLSTAMYSASHPWIKEFFPEGGTSHLGGRPILTSFAHLNLLSHKLQSLTHSSAYTVHCIKPNELKIGNVFEGALVLHQLKYHRIMDILAVTRDGFEISRDFERFLGRYRLLSLRTWPQWNGSLREGILLILSELLIPSDLFFLGRTRLLLKSSLVADLESFRRERLEDLALLVQKTWRGWRAYQKLQRMKRAKRIIVRAWRNYNKLRLDLAEVEGSRRRVAAGKIQRAYLQWKRKSFLRELMTIELPMSPVSWEWPRTPQCLKRGSQEIQRLFHRWRCSVYRSQYIDSTERNRMGEKVTASNLLRGKKMSYPKSVSHPFLGDYVRLRVNSEWRKIAKQDSTLVFADLVQKISLNSGKMTPYLLAVSTISLMVLDPRTLALKQRIALQEIAKLSLSPYADPFIVFHRIRHENVEGDEVGNGTEPCTGCTLFDENPGKRGDILLSTQHLVELVTKVYLVVKNRTGKGPSVHIGEKFDLTFGNAGLQLHFMKRSAGDGSEVLKIGFKQGHITIFL